MRGPRAELEFLKSLWGLETEEEESYCTGPPGCIGWRNSFLGIDSGAQYTFKNTGSGVRWPQDFSGRRAATPFPHGHTIQKLPRLTLINKLQAFLGMVNFYRRYHAQHCLLLDTVYGCRNLERGRTVSLLGIYVSNFQYSAGQRDLRRGTS